MTTTLEHVYEPRGAAVDLFNSQSPEILLSGPAGTGKSRAALEKLHLLCLRNPGMRGLIVRKTLVSLASTALRTWREKVATEALAANIVNYYGGSQEEPPQYRYSNGSTIAIGGMDKPTKIMSSDYDIIYAQEAIELTENDWESCISRLRNGRLTFQQLIGDTNPDRPTHWLKQRCDKGLTVMLYSKHSDNPLYVNEDGSYTKAGKDYIVGKLGRMTGILRERLAEGRWVAAEGVIYSLFDESKHLHDPKVPPRDWPRIWSVDFGYVHPFVLQMWAIDPDGAMHLYREIFHTRRLVEDHARAALEAMKDRHGRHDVMPMRIICDHDAEDRATLERHIGMSTVPANKNVSGGIQAVQSRFKIEGNGKARIHLYRDAVIERDQALVEAKRPSSTVEEIPGYVWMNNGKDQPVKEMDDGMDALRYAVADQDLSAPLGFRFVA